jgi:hypothetical protein
MEGGEQVELENSPVHALVKYEVPAWIPSNGIAVDPGPSIIEIASRWLRRVPGSTTISCE